MNLNARAALIDYEKDMALLKGRFNDSHIQDDYLPGEVYVHVLLTASLNDVLNTELRLCDGTKRRKSREEERPAIWGVKLNLSSSTDAFNKRLLFAAYLVRKHWNERGGRRLRPTSDGGLALGNHCPNTLSILVWHKLAPGLRDMNVWSVDISWSASKSVTVPWLTEPLGHVFWRQVSLKKYNCMIQLAYLYHLRLYFTCTIAGRRRSCLLVQVTLSATSLGRACSRWDQQVQRRF